MRVLIACAGVAALLTLQIPDSQGMTKGPPAPGPSGTSAPIGASGTTAPSAPTGAPQPRPSPRVITVQSGETPALPSPTPEPVQQQFKEALWSVEEGFFVGNNRLIIIWRAEKGIKETTVTRFSGPQQAEVQVIPIEEKTEKELRQRVGKLAIQLPSRATDTDKSKCSHWMEIETLYGKRFFCEGDEAPGAFDFLKDLHELAGN